MEKGTDIDPVEQKPIDSVEAKKAEREQKKEQTLRQQAAFINVLISEEGRLLIDLIARKLEKRILKLVSEDPEARAYEKILSDVKHKENLAKKAINQIYQRQFE